VPVFGFFVTDAIGAMVAIVFGVLVACVDVVYIAVAVTGATAFWATVH